MINLVLRIDQVIKKSLTKPLLNFVKILDYIMAKTLTDIDYLLLYIYSYGFSLFFSLVFF